MPDQKFILRDFIPDDCVHLPELLEKVWKIQTDEDYWIWKYLKPPFSANGWVAEKENGNIVAFTGYWRRPAKICNSNITPAMLVDVMAASEYRGGKVYGAISERIMELIRGETVFGFTNPVSHRLFKNLVKDFIKIDADIPVFVSFIDGGYAVRSNKLIKSIVGSVTRIAHKMRLKIPGNKNVLVQNASNIGDEFDQLWEDVSSEYAFILNRSKDYLQWRYISAHTRKYQIWKAIAAVFESWDNPRAKKYRELNNITGLLGTAVNVQAMVFGNMGDRSGTGVAFTRNPATGENTFYGEFLLNAQGEDVVAGIRTPQPVSHLSNVMPDVYNELIGIKNK